jgi:hypothetical protein
LTSLVVHLGGEQLKKILENKGFIAWVVVKLSSSRVDITLVEIKPENAEQHETSYPTFCTTK